MTRLSPSLLLLIILPLCVPTPASAQETPKSAPQQPSSRTPVASHTGFLAAYKARALATQINQPQWATPLVTTNARIEQGFRADFLRQTAPDGTSTWNLGNTKGLQLIPLPRTELRISPPPFFEHSAPHSLDGLGDIALRLKYRLYGSNEQHHNAIVTAELSASLPTGSHGNGSCCAILTPTLEFGKGIGRIDWQTTFGATLPTSNTIKLGRSLVFNNAIQYHATMLLWIEAEFSSTLYCGGKYDGRQQTFITPGIILSRFPLPWLKGRTQSPLRLTLGAGEQIALTHFNTYNHSPIFTARIRF